MLFPPNIGGGSAMLLAVKTKFYNIAVSSITIVLYTYSDM